MVFLCLVALNKGGNLTANNSAIFQTQYFTQTQVVCDDLCHEMFATRDWVQALISD
jgi:hypothetical protein